MCATLPLQRHPQGQHQAHDMESVATLARQSELTYVSKGMPLSDNHCSACGASGDEVRLRSSMWHEPNLICIPCFHVWYDPDEPIDCSDPEQVGALSNKLRAQGKYPWDDPKSYSPT
jgi:hypothetical protein